MKEMEPRYPGAEPGFFRVSNSGMEEFLKCGVYYWFRRQGGDGKRYASFPMLIGTAISMAAKVSNVAKLEGVVRPQLRDLVDIAVAGFDKALSESFVEKASKLTAAQARDAAAGAARAYGVKIAPQIDEVLIVEEPLIARFPTLGIELAGTPDVFTRNAIRDVKTGQPWNQRRADRSRQLSGYDLLHITHLGKPAERVCIDTVHRDRRGEWTAETLWSVRTERDRSAYLENAQRVHHAIVKGVELPAPEGAWWCAEGWCPFWNKCTARPGA